MNELTVFTNPEFGEIRSLEINGEPWLVGKDVAQALGYSNTRDALTKHVDEEDKGVAKCDTLGGTQELTIINESGLYSLIFSSQLPDAKKFKRWVTSEVLPSIRKTGGYRTDWYHQLMVLEKVASIAETTRRAMEDMDVSPYTIYGTLSSLYWEYANIKLPEQLPVLSMPPQCRTMMSFRKQPFAQFRVSEISARSRKKKRCIAPPT